MATNKSTTNVRSIRPTNIETIRRRAGRARDRLYEAQAIMSCVTVAAIAQCEESGVGLDPAEIRRAQFVANGILNEVIDALDETVIAEAPSDEELAAVSAQS
jgi:hypothetical protein